MNSPFPYSVIYNKRVNMKNFPCIILFALLFAGATGASAQGERIVTDKPVITIDSMQTIFDDLAVEKPGRGTVVVNQPEALRKMVGVHRYGENVELTDSTAFLKIQGFRTQVFSGNNQRASKDEAFEKEEMVKELFPDVPTYVTYTAPFWKLRVGDFRSHEEAYHMLRLLRESFPAFGKEMYIVKEEIQLPLD